MLGGAAQALALNHSTVFRRLRAIERHLGSRLFERNRGASLLTPCGEAMVRMGDERMGEAIVTFERQAAGRDLRPSGKLRVTTDDTLRVNLMPELLAAFRRAYPEIVLDVVVSNQAPASRPPSGWPSAPSRSASSIGSIPCLASPKRPPPTSGSFLLPCFIGLNTPGLKQLSAPKAELANGLWLLTHPDLRQTVRVRAFMKFAAAEIAKRRRTLEGTS